MRKNTIRDKRKRKSETENGTEGKGHSVYHSDITADDDERKVKVNISLDQNKLFVSESLVPLTQLAKWYKEPTKQFSEL